MAVARLGTGTQFSQVDPVDAMSLNAGNRFDVVGGGSSTPRRCSRAVIERSWRACGRPRSAGEQRQAWREQATIVLARDGKSPEEMVAAVLGGAVGTQPGAR